MGSEIFQLMDNEKFTCLAFEGISVSDNLLESVYLGNEVWVLQKAPFNIDNHWKEWLGTLRLEHFSNSSFLILAKKESVKPEILDEENKDLEQAAYAVWYSTLLDGIPHIEGGMIISGAKRNGELDVRSTGSTDTFYRPHLVMPKRICAKTIDSSQLLFRNLLELFSLKGKFIRFKKGFYSWIDGLKEDRADNRLHKFVRVIEAVIKPRIAKTSRDFVHRSKFFLNAPDAEKILNEIYGIRCSVEHLNNWEESLTEYAESKREEIASLRSYQTQLLASSIIKKVISSKSLWPIFTEDDKIEEFWKQPDHVKSSVLGKGFDIEFVCKMEFKPY